MIIKAILFDCDGVVVTPPARFSQQFSQEFNIPIEELNSFFDNQFQACVIGQNDLKNCLESNLQSWGWTKSVDALLKYWFESENHPNKPLIQLIKLIQKQGTSCYLATNQEQYRLKFLAEKMGLIHIFDHMFVSCEIKSKKPTTKYFQYVWDSLEYLDDLEGKGQVLFIDDNRQNIQAAEEFGFNTCHYLSYEQCLNKLKELDIYT